MEHQELLHTEIQDGFEINLYALPEYDSPDWDFENEEEKAQLLKRIDRGQVLWFCAKVTASKAGVELGSDYLGGCCYDSIEQFTSDGYYADMKATAINEAKAKIQELTK